MIDVEEKKHIKIVLNENDTTKFYIVKKWLGVSSDAEVLRILLHRGYTSLQETGNPFSIDLTQQ